MISVHHSRPLMDHLSTHEVDGSTVASALFEGGRLSYPERRRIEHELCFIEPYGLEHEARVLVGMPPKWNAACRFLSRLATARHGAVDPTLELLWGSHDAFSHRERVAGPQALDRLIAALVTVHQALGVSFSLGRQLGKPSADTMLMACEILVRGLNAEGFPPSSAAIEEICDGAPPACVGLGLVDIDWRSE